MNKRHEEILKECLLRYKENWDKNQYQRTQYDQDLEYYRGYRNHADYPLAFNVSFNKILPIIYTILSRFMEQMFQTSNIVSVKPRKHRDLERAKSAESILNYQLEALNEIDQQGGAYLTFFRWFFNTITFGKGIVKAYWRKEERITPRRMVLPRPAFDRFDNFQGWDHIDTINTENRVTYNGPYVENIHNKLFVPDPTYKSIQLMPMCFLVYQRSMDYVKEMADKGVYKNIKDMDMKPYMNKGASYSSGKDSDSDEAFWKSIEIESAFHTDDEASDRRAPMVDILECYGRMILENEPYSVGSGYSIKGKEEEVIIHIGNYSALLSIQRNKYNTRPLFDMGCYYHPELFWDLGMVNLTSGIQEQVNNLANLRIQNAMMMINPMLKVNLAADIDPESLVWRPFGIVGVDDNNDIEPLVIPDTNSNLFMEQESFYKNSIQDIMGMYDYCEIVEGKNTDYEILTDEGWKQFDSLNHNEEVMTLNYETDEMQWQKPTDYIDSPVLDFDCYKFKSQNAEFICSPKHRLPLVSNGKKKIERIKDIPEKSYSSHAIPIAGFNWRGNNNWHPPFLNITREDWCAFMGIWIAEGHTSKANGAYQVGVAQDKKANHDKYIEIERLLERLSFNFRTDKNNTQFYTYNKELYNYLEIFGKSKEKFVPEEIKNSSPYLLKIFLDWYLMGDGSRVRNEDRFTTVSEQLADDIQEITLKLGSRSALRWDSGHERWSGEISLNHRNVYLRGNKSKSIMSKEKVKGRMTCLTVPNGIFLIRRNKKPMWTGNSMGQTPQRKENVGTIYGVQQMGEARTKLLLMSMDYLGMRPLLRFLMTLNTWHLPTGFEYRIGDNQQQQKFGRVFGNDLHSDFDFSARYTSMEPALGKQFRSQQLISMASLWNQNPWINQYQYNKTMMELLDIREVENLMKTPQQFQQEMQQQIQRQMMAQRMEVQGDTEAKVKKSIADSQGRMNVTNLKGQYDLALGAMQLAAENKKTNESASK